MAKSENNPDAEFGSELDDVEDMEDLESAMDSMFGSPAVHLMLVLMGFGIAVLLYSFTRGSMILFDRWIDGFGWIVAPTPLLIFGLLSWWQAERGWLQQAGAAAIGFALANYVMMAIETNTSA